MAPRKQGAFWAVRSGMRVGAAGIVSGDPWARVAGVSLGRNQATLWKIFAARGATWRGELRTIKTPRESYECTEMQRATKEPLAVGSS